LGPSIEKSHHNLDSILRMYACRGWWGNLVRRRFNANKWIVPSIAPPPWLFGPVWALLYVLIATSGYRISYLKSSDLKSIALGLWALQMCLNTLWTPVFFGAFDLQGALGIILALWLTITAYVIVSFKIDRASSYLFAPYWAWVTFATVLNFAYILVNTST
jgi:tryptophan-rich sensory protein